MSGAVKEAAGSDLVRRYIREWDEPDEYTCDVVWRDRLTGKCVLRYDGADPANTDPAYGAPSDEERFRRRGLQIKEKVEAELCVLPVASGEAEALRREEARRAERDREEAEARELFSLIGDEAAAFNHDDWRNGELMVFTPALEARGYTKVSFYMIEKDSFGALIRGAVAHDQNGKRVRFYYG